ncbi:hypothetical protein ACFRAR_30335 [Kitasatospora sp. NPDC056651]|uniref:hypothetical protein n=1 Tax=Kitasatospora sp. NPDC056651 TaxID=3345892 RepID=UPI0036B601C5
MTTYPQETALRPRSERGDGIRLPRFTLQDLPAFDFALPIVPELVAPEEVPAPWAYKRFRDLEAKEAFRTLLLKEIDSAFEELAPGSAAEASTALRHLLNQMTEKGAVVLADIVDAQAFRTLVERYDGIMAQEGSGSFIHRFVDLRRSIGLLTDPAVNQPLLHPLMVALISYAVGGPVRIVDARAKDAEPLSVLAQDNMLHIDNTPFNDEYKILVTWRRGTTEGPSGQNFTFLPGTHKLARSCFTDDESTTWSSENASIFTTPDSIRKVFAAQQRLNNETRPAVVEVCDPERPLSSVFAAGSLVHHRFRTASGQPRSCVIVAFHRVADNPGRLVSDIEDTPNASLSELLTCGAADESYGPRFLALLKASAGEIADLLARWGRRPDRPVPLPLPEQTLSGQRFDEWMAAATEAPKVQEIRDREQVVPFGEILLREEFFDLVWRLMRFDKHGPLDLILHHDNHEEPRKWARNLIREASKDRLHERLAGWSQDLEQPRPSDALLPRQVRDLVTQVLDLVKLDGSQQPPADWRGDLSGMSPEVAGLSVTQLLRDLSEAVVRCEDLPAYLSTCLFVFWAVDAAYSLDGRRNTAVQAISLRLLRHYVLLSLTSAG